MADLTSRSQGSGFLFRNLPVRKVNLCQRCNMHTEVQGSHTAGQKPAVLFGAYCHLPQRLGALPLQEGAARQFLSKMSQKQGCPGLEHHRQGGLDDHPNHHSAWIPTWASSRRQGGRNTAAFLHPRWPSGAVQSSLLFSRASSGPELAPRVLN